jgi:hypothetical protein
MNKILKIILEAVPILLMIVLIPIIKDDYYLLLSFIIIIAISLYIKYEKDDYKFFIFGLIALTLSEYLFISVGVETFNRNSLFGIMPIWLPILWAYAFIAIKRSINILK